MRTESEDVWKSPKTWLLQVSPLQQEHDSVDKAVTHSSL